MAGFRGETAALIRTGFVKWTKAGTPLSLEYGLSTEVGAIKWTKSLGAPVVGVPKVVGDKVFVFTNAPNVTCLRGDAGPDVLWTLDGAERLHDELDRLGVIDQLDSRGAAPGDTVFLGELELEYAG